MDNQKSHYAELGLSPFVSQEDIHSSYRAAVKTYNVARKDPAADQTKAYKDLERITRAFEALNTPEKSKAYDEAYFPERAEAVVEFIHIMAELNDDLEGKKPLKEPEKTTLTDRLMALTKIHSIHPDELEPIMEHMGNHLEHLKDPKFLEGKSEDEIKEEITKVLTVANILGAMRGLKADILSEGTVSAQPAQFRAAASDAATKAPVDKHPAQREPPVNWVKLTAEKEAQLSKLVEDLSHNPKDAKLRAELAQEVNVGNFTAEWLEKFAQKNMEWRERDWDHDVYRQGLAIIIDVIAQKPSFASGMNKYLFFALKDDNPKTDEIADRFLDTVLSANPKCLTRDEMHEYCRHPEMLVNRAIKIIGARPDLAEAIQQGTLNQMYADPRGVDRKSVPHMHLFRLGLENGVITDDWLRGLENANDKRRSPMHEPEKQAAVRMFVEQVRPHVAGRPPNPSPDSGGRPGRHI